MGFLIKWPPSKQPLVYQSEISISKMAANTMFRVRSVGETPRICNISIFITSRFLSKQATLYFLLNLKKPLKGLCLRFGCLRRAKSLNLGGNNQGLLRLGNWTTGWRNSNLLVPGVVHRASEEMFETGRRRIHLERKWESIRLSTSICSFKFTINWHSIYNVSTWFCPWTPWTYDTMRTHLWLLASSMISEGSWISWSGRHCWGGHLRSSPAVAPTW